MAVAVQARGRDQRGQALDQFQGREAQRGAPIGLGLGEAIDELVVGDLLEPSKAKGGFAQVAQLLLALSLLTVVSAVVGSHVGMYLR